MKIVIACDSYKEALEAPQVCRAIARGILSVYPKADIVLIPLADGGEGTAEILGLATAAKKMKIKVLDPLFRPVMASYYLSGDGQIAFMDMAEASGLNRVSRNERNPLKTSTLGTGEMIAHAVNQGVRRILMGIGGSATNDGGMGMATALGYSFFDAFGQKLQGRGEDLARIDRISGFLKWKPQKVAVEVLCDVKNPLFGPKGASRTYGPQKGASGHAVEMLDRGLMNLSEKVKLFNGMDMANVPGSGAAGGLGYGLKVFLDASLRSGTQAVLDYTGVKDHLRHADLVITGEGRLDTQTASGKLIDGLSRLAGEMEVPIIALCGQLDATADQLSQLGLSAAYSINPEGIGIEEAIKRTEIHLIEKTREIITAHIPENLREI